MTEIEKAKAVWRICANLAIPLSGSDRARMRQLLRMIEKAERAEVVAEIVAWLNGRAGQVLQLHAEAKTDHERNIVDEHASALEQSAIEIEAKFGGRDETR